MLNKRFIKNKSNFNNMVDQKSESLGKVKLQHNGTFDLNKVHIAIADWINSHNYAYTEKENTEKGARRGLESVIKFEAQRKVSDYVEFELAGEIRTFEMKRKGKLQEGELVV